MALSYNALEVNGISTGSLPFLVIVEVNAAPTMAKSKSIFTSLPMVDGNAKQTINAYEAVEKKYDIYLHNVKMDEVRIFKKLLGTSGSYKSYDDPQITRYYDDVLFESETLSAIDGYHVHVTFVCDPYEYEEEKLITVTNGMRLVNHTNASMKPKIMLTLVASESVKWIKIGDKQMAFSVHLPGVITIENKHGFQNVFFKSADTGAEKKINSFSIGGFFNVPVGESVITYSPGITKVEMLTRWGWR